MTAKELAREIYAELDRQQGYVGDFNFPNGEGSTTCLDGDFDLEELAAAKQIACLIPLVRYTR